MTDERRAHAFETEPVVPPAVLDELLAAFGATDAPDVDVDLDAPEIDALLGLDEPVADAPDPGDASETASAAATSAAPDPGDASAAADEPAAGTGAGTAAVTAAVTTAKPSVIVIGDDDGLPDAVYLDEEAEERLRATHGGPSASGGDNRGTILIGDDDDESMSAGIPLATGPTSIDPRIRARRIAVKRTEGRRRLRWVLIGGGVLLVIVAVLALLGSSLFAIDADAVEIDGAVYTDGALLQAVVDDLAGSPVLTVDTRAAERKLESIAWVERARVTTDFPRGARIEIRERTPLATYQGVDGRYRVIDADGRVLDVLDGRPLAYMLVTSTGGIAAPDVAEGGFAGVTYARAAQVVSAMTPEIRIRTASVGVGSAASPGSGAPAGARDTSSGELTLQFVEGTTVRLGAPSDLQEKLARLQFEILRNDGDPPVEIDVSTDEATVR